MPKEARTEPRRSKRDTTQANTLSTVRTDIEGKMAQNQLERNLPPTSGATNQNEPARNLPSTSGFRRATVPANSASSVPRRIQHPPRRNMPSTIFRLKL
eukprot:Seg1956.1 transcript_id=Seg1956.1/GoldUCD/mRNA.D3Y31 product="hypothetical protein" pseudo=true protein_id=Seg1956.1/GoldUCD/D3Y31